MNDRTNASREYVSRAAAGICIGAVLMIFVPAEITSLAGLEQVDHMVAVKIAAVAAAVSFVARRTRVTIRRR
jgi:hypothetical protein